MEDESSLIFQVRLHYELGQFNEAIKKLDILSQQHPTFDSDHRNLFSVVYKDAINPLRESLRTLSASQNTQIQDHNQSRADLIEMYIQKTKKDLIELCKHGINTILTNLLLYADTIQGKVFYLKTRGDLHRYISELNDPIESPKANREAKLAYDTAIATCDTELPYSDPIRLGAILNSAVFEFEHENNFERARELLQDAIRKSQSSLDELSEDDKREADSILYSMNNNLIIWSEQNVR